MELNEKQKRILQLLKENNELATTKISFLISSNLYQTEEYLKDLKMKNLIISYQRFNFTYWRLKENGNQNKFT